MTSRSFGRDADAESRRALDAENRRAASSANRRERKCEPGRRRAPEFASPPRSGREVRDDRIEQRRPGARHSDPAPVVLFDEALGGQIVDLAL